MLKKNSCGDFPKVHRTSYIDPLALVIGRVNIGKNVFVGPFAVIRADEPKSSITIKNSCNVQDRVVIHALKNTSVKIDESTSLSHGCIVHGPCKISRSCFIGFGSVVFNAKLAEGVIVKHLSVVDGVNIPSKKLVTNGSIIDSDCKLTNLKIVNKELRKFTKEVVKTNLMFAKSYKNIIYK